MLLKLVHIAETACILHSHPIYQIPSHLPLLYLLFIKHQALHLFPSLTSLQQLTLLSQSIHSSVEQDQIITWWSTWMRVDSSQRMFWYTTPVGQVPW